MRSPPPICCQQYHWPRPFQPPFVCVSLNPYTRDLMSTANRLSGASLFSDAKYFSGNLTYIFLLQLTALYLAHSGQITGYTPLCSWFWHLPGLHSLAWRPDDSLLYSTLLSYILFSKLLIVCVVNLCPPLYLYWSAVPQRRHINAPAESLLLTAIFKGLTDALYVQRCSYLASHCLTTIS